MNILPFEVLENIFTFIPYKDNKIELVCKKWDSICKYTKLKEIRNPCMCNDGPFQAHECKSQKHNCICHKSLHDANSCNSNNHPCICKNGIHHTRSCQSDNHVCMCDIHFHFYHLNVCKNKH
jgi:hypothetical protein